MAQAFKSQGEDGPAANCTGTTDLDPARGNREPTLGSAEDSGGIGAAGVQSFGQNDSQVYASNQSSRAVFPLAAVPEAARFDCLGVRFLLHPDHHVSNTVRVLVIHHASRQVLHVHVTPHPTAEWAAQQIVECCRWDRVLPRFLVHDRDPCFGTGFDRRVRNLGIAQARTPFRSPRANALAERWVRSVRTECVDHVFIFNERHLQKVLAEYVGYFNYWRPHRSIGQRAPCAPRTLASDRSDQAGRISQYQCLEVSITSISRPHDLPDRIFAPFRC